MVRIPEMPPDETFPQLQVVTSLEPMREILQQDLPRFAHGELEIDRLKIKRFHYRHGASQSGGAINLVLQGTTTNLS